MNENRNVLLLWVCDVGLRAVTTKPGGRPEGGALTSQVGSSIMSWDSTGIKYIHEDERKQNTKPAQTETQNIS